MVKLVENTEETVHAKKLLDQLRSEVREALSGFEQIGDDELYDCIEQGRCRSGRAAVSAPGTED